MRWLLLLLFATFNALADLPTMEDPSRGQGKGGRKQWKDLGSMAGVGSILLVVIIWLLNQASDVL